MSRESERTLADIEADGDSDSEFESGRPFDENHPFATTKYDDETSNESEEEEDDGDGDGEENVDAALNPNKWNDPEDAFEHYLVCFMGPPPDTEEGFTEEEDKEDSCASMMSTPGLSLSFSILLITLPLFIPAILAVRRLRPILPLLTIRPLT